MKISLSSGGKSIGGAVIDLIVTLIDQWLRRFVMIAWIQDLIWRYVYKVVKVRNA